MTVVLIRPMPRFTWSCLMRRTALSALRLSWTLIFSCLAAISKTGGALIEASEVR